MIFRFIVIFKSVCTKNLALALCYGLVNGFKKAICF